MAGGRVVPVPLGDEVGEGAGVEPAHPVVGVGAVKTVRDVLVRLLGRQRRAGHRRHRTSRLASLAPQPSTRWLVAPALLAPPAPARAGGRPPRPAKAAQPGSFTVRLPRAGDSFHPFF